LLAAFSTASGIASSTDRLGEASPFAVISVGVGITSILGSLELRLSSIVLKDSVSVESSKERDGDSAEIGWVKVDFGSVSSMVFSGFSCTKWEFKGIEVGSTVTVGSTKLKDSVSLESL